MAPVGAATYSEALRAGAEVFAALGSLFHAEGHSTGRATRAALPRACRRTRRRSRSSSERSRKRAIAPARTLPSRSTPRSARSSSRAPGRGDIPAATASTPKAHPRHDKLINLWGGWLDRYPIMLARGRDRRGTRPAGVPLKPQFGDRVQLVGDDVFVTRIPRHQARYRGARRKRGAHQAQSDRDPHRDDPGDRPRSKRRLGGDDRPPLPGETEDTTIADLVVGLGTGQIKSGAPSRWSGSPSTTGSFASRRSSAARRATRAEPPCRPHWRRGNHRPMMRRFVDRGADGPVTSGSGWRSRWRSASCWSSRSGRRTCCCPCRAG